MDDTDTFEQAKQSSLKAGEHKLSLIRKNIQDKNALLQTLIDTQQNKLLSLQQSIQDEKDSIQKTQDKYETVIHDIQQFQQQILDAEQELIGIDEKIKSTQENNSVLHDIETLETELNQLKMQHTTKIHEYEKKIEFFFADTKNS